MLNSSFYTKLAANNLKRNSNVYLPFLVSCIGTIFTYFIFIAISMNTGMESLPDGPTLQKMFVLGKCVISFFATIFIFYANSFLMKRRMKEIGLYGILGLEKRHIAYVMLIETLILCAISVVLGILIGMVFGKLFFILLLNILHATGTNTFNISFQAITQTMIFFITIFLLTFIFNFIKVKTANTISLLKSEAQGEKEPKTPIIMTIVGIVTLCSGYGIALTVNSAATAVGSFIIAVILVMIGTYALFTAGSITLLKSLKKNKKVFYQPKNFVSISNMIYRMKKNAVGLANICILSTIVLIVVSTTFSLYAGKNNILNNRNQFDLGITFTDTNMDTQQLTKTIINAANSNDVQIKENYQYRTAEFTSYFSDEQFGTVETVNENDLHDCNYDVTIIPLHDYNIITKRDHNIEDNEVMLYSLNGSYNSDNISFSNGKDVIKFNVKEELTDFILFPKKVKKDLRQIYIIVKDSAQIEKLQLVIGCSNLHYNTIFNIKGSETNRLSFANSLRKKVSESYNISYFSSIDIDGSKWYSAFGGLLFLGIFLGFLFMIALVLIIYFKQISEGYEDHDRFTILQKVGMDKDEVQKTINKQIKFVFFLPLIGAVLHVAVAYRIICSMLASFNLTDTTLILICILVVGAIFSIVYGVIYSMTTKVYYKLVRS